MSDVILFNEEELKRRGICFMQVRKNCLQPFIFMRQFKLRCPCTHIAPGPTGLQSFCFHEQLNLKCGLFEMFEGVHDWRVIGLRICLTLRLLCVGCVWCKVQPRFAPLHPEGRRESGRAQFFIDWWSLFEQEGISEHILPLKVNQTRGVRPRYEQRLSWL